jgi:hypothetical protein
MKTGFLRIFILAFIEIKRTFYTILKIVLIIVNINKDENKSLISNQFFLKKITPPHTSWRTILRR